MMKTEKNFSFQQFYIYEFVCKTFIVGQETEIKPTKDSLKGST